MATPIPQRIAIVGAGAVGVVHADALARAGCEVSFVVRPGRVEETRAGVTLTHVPLLGARWTTRVTPHEVLASWDEVRCRSFDQLWVATPTNGQDEAFVAELAGARGKAIVCILSPGAHLAERYARHLPEASLVRGSIALLCWQAPMEGSDNARERATAPGYACLLAPGRGAGFAGPAADALVSLLVRGGLPAHRDAHADRTLAFGTAVLMPHVVALEIEQWSFASLARSEVASIAARATQEALAITARRYGVPVPWIERSLLTPPLTRLGLRLAPGLAPLDLEGFFRVHFRKVSAQTRFLVEELTREGEGLGLPSDALRELARRATLPLASV